jgi:hypothetical protein
MIARIEDEIVAVALAPRLGYAEAERGGFVKEGGFGNFSATLGREDRRRVGL